MNGFNAVDIVAVLWLLIGLWRGVRQGLAGALLRLLAVGAAVGVGLLGYAWLGEKMSGTGRLAGAASDLLAFLLITTAVYAVLRLLGLLLKNTVTQMVYKHAISTIVPGRAVAFNASGSEDQAPAA